MPVKYLFMLAGMILVASCTPDIHQKSPTDVAARVADRLVAMTVFETQAGPEHPVQDNSLRVRFMQDLPYVSDASYHARMSFLFDATADVHGLLLGLSQTPGTLELYLNGTRIHTQKPAQKQVFDHTDYGLFRYGSYVSLPVADGRNDLEIRMRPADHDPVITFGFIRADNGLRNPAVTISAPENRTHPLEIAIVTRDSQPPAWIEPTLNTVTRLTGPLDLADWRYFTGTFLDALITLSREHPELDYNAYVNRHLDFFLNLKDTIASERAAYGLRESAFGHFFRYNLLDDIGMQAVPYVERIRDTYAGRYQSAPEYELVRDVADFILKRADRLPDGTWARFTPDTMSVWADDLFMASIVLNRMSSLTGDERYITESARQAILFDQHLRDEATNVYWHGFYSRNREHSSSKWGRANGWTMMAKTDLLLHLPETHPLYSDVLQVFIRQSDGLRQLQSADGRWHQVLDNPETYLETSCTAMFVRAFAEGVMQGWLDRDTYDAVIQKGWDAVVRQVDPDGTVQGIVRGTPIMFSDEEYHNWPTRPHDPRGLGAVLLAASTMERYLNR